MIEQKGNATSKHSALKVFIGGIPQSWEPVHVAQLMQKFGNVINVEIKRDETGYSKGYGFAYLEDHLPPKHIYGRHHYYNAVIEVKELKQKYIYVCLNENKKMTEAVIVDALVEQGHELEFVELGSNFPKLPSNYARITFQREASAKWFLNRRYVEIDGVCYTTSAVIESYKNRLVTSNQKGNKTKNSSNAKVYENGKHHQKDKHISQEPDHFHNVSPKLVDKQESILKEEYIEPTATKVKSKPNSTQSSDGHHSSHEKAEDLKPIRKLSYKGKNLEFHPSLPLPQTNAPVVASPQNVQRHQGSPSAKSPMQRDQPALSQSKLSSASMDWNMENLMMWSDPMFAAKMSLPPFAVQNGLAYLPLETTKSAEWSAVKDSQLEHLKKREVWIEFFTYPGCA